MQSELEALVTPVSRLSRDLVKGLRQGGGGITKTEARFMVDLYYTMQEQRIRVNNQVKGLERDAKKTESDAEPHAGLDWTLTQFSILERQVAKLLQVYTETHPMAWFFEQTMGIGPVLASGLLAHIDIEKAPTVGHIWNFAGLNPDIKWEKGQKRPWNTPLKTLCWKIGDSFVKVSGRPEAIYGKIYRERKAYEWKRNIAGECAHAAENALANKKIGKSTDAHAWYAGQCSAEKAALALEEGKAPTAAACRVENGTPMIPPMQIDMRARRYATKLFLSHLHQRWREHEGLDVPKPFAIGILNHGHFIEPPQRDPALEDHTKAAA